MSRDRIPRSTQYSRPLHRSPAVYNFQLSYGECCAGPAELIWSFRGAPVGGAVPEPATWAMMLLGFGGIGFAMRRGRKQNERLLQVA